MNKKQILTGTVHKIPNDLKKTITSTQVVLNAWNNLTQLARNEWICWITSFKKAETRTDHIKRAREDLTKGKRRPCCWPGCPHS